MPRIKDIEGQKFGRLLVESITKEYDTSGSIYWNCICDCGTYKKASGADLRRGVVKSCGCLVKEQSFVYGKINNRKHGMYKSKTYNSWALMKQRCTDINSKHYINYGAKGITICEEWLDFQNFLRDMGECPADKRSIDRIDNSKGYEITNCRWVTSAEQNRNYKRNLYYEFKGERKILTDWASEYKIHFNTLKYRITKLGWSIEKALTTPPKKVGRGAL